jgi:hypothetical protein
LAKKKKKTSSGPGSDSVSAFEGLSLEDQKKKYIEI